MGDQKLNIEIVTSQTGEGAKKAAEDLGKVNAAVREGTRVTREQVEAAVEADQINANYARHRAAEAERVASVQKAEAEKAAAAQKAAAEKAAAEAEKAAAAQQAAAAKAAAANEAAAAKTGRSWKTVGNVIRSLATGDMAGAANAATELGGKFVAIGGAAAAAIASVVMAVRAGLDRVNARAAALNEIKFKNFEASAKSLGERFEEVTGKIDAAKAAADALAEASVAVNEAEHSARVATVNARRNQELAGINPDDKEAKNRINAKYDEELAGLSAARDRERIGEERAKRERERTRIQEQLATLGKRDEDYYGTLQNVAPNIDQAERDVELYGGNDNAAVQALAKLGTLGIAGKRVATARENVNRFRGMQTTALKGLGDNELKRRELRQQLAVLDAQGQADPYRELNVEATHSGARYGARILEREADNEREKNREKERAEAAKEAKKAAEKENAQLDFTWQRFETERRAEAVQSAEKTYKSSPTVENAKALKEAQAALKEEVGYFKELASAIQMSSREKNNLIKRMQADLSAD